MARYYFPLLSVNPLRVTFSLKLHMNIATTLSCLLIITRKIPLSFFNLVVNTLFFVNQSSEYHLALTLSLTISVKNSEISKNIVN